MIDGSLGGELKASLVPYSSTSVTQFSTPLRGTERSTLQEGTERVFPFTGLDYLEEIYDEKHRYKIELKKTVLVVVLRSN